jgi:restriction system protein
MLGKKSARAAECFAGNYIGSGFGSIKRDVGHELTDDFRAFSQNFIPEMQALYPDKSKIALGLWSGFAWTICKGIRIDDIVLCPDGSGRYRIGEVTGEYYYVVDGGLPHRRPVRWLTQTIGRADMSQALRHSAGSIGTIAEITKYSDELEKLIGGTAPPTLISTDTTVEDPASFALEEHLEDFLVQNWAQTELGKQYDIYEEDNERVGQQYPTDTGPLDILAVSKDRKTLAVVELKKGRASDVVVGQCLRYMGYVQEELAEKDQAVKGIIIALEDDQRIRRALKMTPGIEFYRYEVSFKLVKGETSYPIEKSNGLRVMQ